MDKYDLPASAIIIELTERQLIIADEENRASLERYKKLGVAFSMDDFGTGYSNLAYLMDKPFNTLKIDRSFISKLNKEPKSAELVRATISIAKALKLETIGEGIETKEQYQFLLDNGCDFAQGFYLCVPKPIAELKELLIGSNKIQLDDL
jgi:two-component system CheB/CheR fusion protein